jgi:GNAT superfamily N-acetyltransferase
MEYDQLAGDLWLGHAFVIEVRAIRPGEGELLLATTLELARSHGWEETVVAKAEDFEFALFRPDPVIGAVMAFVDGIPAGTAVWHRSFSTNRGCEVMYLEDLSVLPAFRRRGVAQALMKEVAKVAVSKGYPSIYWMMMGWNESARKLYEKVGAEMENDNCFCRIYGEKLLELAK